MNERVVYAQVCEYEANGFRVSMTDADTWEYVKDDANKRELARIAIPEPDTEWLVKAGLEYAEEQRDRAAADYQQAMSRLTDFESKFLCLQAPQAPA